METGLGGAALVAKDDDEMAVNTTSIPVQVPSAPIRKVTSPSVPPAASVAAAAVGPGTRKPCYALRYTLTGWMVFHLALAYMFSL
eukprot:m.82421 g.82421  ORF g.82421 m.82421 type:complete len:85 (+) comp36290_c0_seq1:129-383(+)